MPVHTSKEAQMLHRTHTQKTLAWRTAKAALVVMAIAAAAPALAQARFAPGDVVGRQSTTHYSSAQLNQLDELGPKYVTIHRPNAPIASTTGSPAGFDWADTGVGLGSAAFALCLIAATRMLIKRRRRDARPEQGTLAGA